MKKACSIFMAVAMSLTTATVPVFNASAASVSSSSYPEALKASIMFYDANKCGKDVANDNVFSWRGACHTTDGENGVDLTGGFHDCGDHIKFGITNGYAASILGWSLYEFKGAFDASGNTKKMLSTLKYFTDYIMKCRISSSKYCYHIGDPSDHDYWGPPEQQTGSRSTIRYMGSGQGAADVCGLYSGALSLMYLNYKDIDQAYANKCLEYSKELYALGKNNPGVGNADGFYNSSDWKDDMAWAAMWLYVIEKNNSYLNDVNTWVPSPATNWTICWNDMKLAVAAVGAEFTGDSKYKDALSSSLSYWKNSVTTSNGGLKILDSWGTLRYTSSECLLALVYYKLYKDESAKSFAKSQIDYILGNNPANMSYIIGFGSNYPKHPHHRAASGYVGWNDWKSPAKNVLTGALVGGPDQSDRYNDQTDAYTCTEVGIDYNAGLVGAMAGMVQFYSDLPQYTEPPVTATPTSAPTNPPVLLGDLNNDNSINAIDFAAYRQFLLGINTNINMAAADLNEDGNTNAIDFAILRKLLLGIIDSLPYKG
jgi:endoglucanase